MSGYDRTSGNGIIEISAERHRGAFRHLGCIERHWRDVRGTRLVPTRTEIDPRGLTGALSNAFVLERIAKGLARFRISGSHMSDLMGLEVRGMPLSTIFLPEARQELADAVEAVFDDPSIVRFGLEAETGFGRPTISGEMILLPLRSDLGEVSRILGGIEMTGEIGRSPRRMRILRQSRQGLTGRGEPGAGAAGRFVEEVRHAAPTPPRQAAPRRGRVALTLVVDNTK